MAGIIPESDAPVAPRPNLPEFSVSELSHALKRTVETAFPFVRLRGEISGYRGPHSSGHAYFTLKDEGAKIDAVCFKGVFQKLKVKPQEGLEVIATGRITTYPGKSSYQIIVEAIEPAGIGALLALLEERRKKLTAEGLFDPARKQLLPFLPDVIGVVTSPTGAVIRDILHRLADRFPRRVLLWPVTVQGEKAAPEIAAAIQGFNAAEPDGKFPRPDVLIVARGGGSIEDLWAFNEEIVVRAAADSQIPLISAVGHETDTTLIDFAADVRAPTPTAAAEMAVPVKAELDRTVAQLASRLVAARTRQFETARQRLRDLTRALPRRETLFDIPRQRLDMAAGRLNASLKLLAERHKARLERSTVRFDVRRVLDSARAGLDRLTPLLATQRLAEALSRHRQRVAELEARAQQAANRHVRDCMTRLEGTARLLETLGHRATLARGFALVRDGAGRLIRNARSAGPGDELAITLADGDVRATVTESTAAESSARPAKPRAAKPRPQGQGDLF